MLDEKRITSTIGTEFEQGKHEAAVEAKTQPIERKDIKKAYETFKKYKEGKANLEKRIVNNEQWYKMRHWEQMRKKSTGERAKEPMPSSGWLFNVIMNKHADCMDSVPEPNVLPREEGDKAEAEALSSIIPVILEQNDFEQVYSDCSWYKLKNGTACYGVFWSSDKCNGLGDVSIKQIDLLNLYWEPGVKDIQESQNVFYTQLVDIDVMEQMYPDLKGKLKSDTGDVKQYLYDDSIDTDNKCTVIDWYYHRWDGMKKVLHYCKFCGDNILYSSENISAEKEEENAQIYAQAIMNGGDREDVPPEPPQPQGWYEHGKFPFVFDVLFPEEGLPTGFGYIDIGKEPQESIDRLNNDIEIACRWETKPRYFVRGDGGINEEELNDLSKVLVHVDANLGEDSIRRIDSEKLSPIFLNVLNNKIDELKETSGNRDVNSGGTVSGVTSASGIAALQESSGKTSRDLILTSYRAYRQVINLVIELIRQFYDAPRQFRVIGEMGMERFMTYTNQGMQPQPYGVEFGIDMGYRLPEFDIKVSAQKKNPYNKVSQNELALQLYGNGFFNPQLADQALAALDMMDFDDKYEVMQKVQLNGTLFMQMQQMKAQMLQMAQIIDSQNGTTLSQDIAAGVNGEAGADVKVDGGQQIAESDQMGSVKQKENPIVARARANTADATSPR